MEQQTPIPQNQGWSQARAKIHHLPILDFWIGWGGGGGGGGGSNFPSTLSKIVEQHVMKPKGFELCKDNTVWPTGSSL